MAGFPKYPVPRYMQLRMWIINRNWKRNSLNLFVGSVLLGIILSRTFLLHNYVSTPFNTIANPGSFDAPRVNVYLRDSSKKAIDA